MRDVHIRYEVRIEAFQAVPAAWLALQKAWETEAKKSCPGNSIAASPQAATKGINEFEVLQQSKFKEKRSVQSVEAASEGEKSEAVQEENAIWARWARGRKSKIAR
jgi:hypothetical protein